jgi:hypothetical protein
MKTRRLLLLVVCLALPASAAAQSKSSSGSIHGHFFLYGAPAEPPGAGLDLSGVPRTSSTSLVHLGGGGEAAVGSGFGVGTDFGGIIHAAAGRTVETIALDAFYHARGQHPTRLDPYLAGGISGFFYDRQQRTGGLCAAAGVNYWLAPRRGYNVGLGVEIRQNLDPALTEVRVSVRLWQ